MLFHTSHRSEFNYRCRPDAQTFQACARDERGSTAVRHRPFSAGLSVGGGVAFRVRGIDMFTEQRYYMLNSGVGTRFANVHNPYSSGPGSQTLFPLTIGVRF